MGAGGLGYLHALQNGSTLLLQNSARVLDGLSSSSPDVPHPDGHSGHARLTHVIVLLELGMAMGEDTVAKDENASLETLAGQIQLCLVLPPHSQNQ